MSDMTHDDRLAEAVAWLKHEKENCHCHQAGLPMQCSNCDRRDTAINFIETYLSQGEGWPTSKTMICEWDSRVDIGPENRAERRGFNEALRLCKLAAARDLSRERERVMGAVEKVGKEIVLDYPTLSYLHCQEINERYREAVEGEGR